MAAWGYWPQQCIIYDGMDWVFLAGVGLLVMGRKRFSWIIDVKWRKYCDKQKLNPSKTNRSWGTSPCLEMLQLRREKEKSMEIMRSQRRKEKERTRETEGARNEIDRESLEPWQIITSFNYTSLLGYEICQRSLDSCLCNLKTKWLCWFHGPSVWWECPGTSSPADGWRHLHRLQGTNKLLQRAGPAPVRRWTCQSHAPAPSTVPARQNAPVPATPALPESRGKAEAAAKPGSASSCRATEPSLCSITILKSQHSLSHWSLLGTDTAGSVAASTRGEILISCHKQGVPWLYTMLWGSPLGAELGIELSLLLQELSC